MQVVRSVGETREERLVVTGSKDIVAVVRPKHGRHSTGARALSLL
jgi:hypothetical protein